MTSTQKSSVALLCPLVIRSSTFVDTSIPGWEQTEDIKYTIRKTTKKEEKEKYWGDFRGRAAAALPGGDDEAETEALLVAFLESAEGTIADKKVIRRPSFGRRKKGVSKEWRKVRTWARRIRRVLGSLHRGDCTWADVNLLTWRFQIPIPELFVDTLGGAVADQFQEGKLVELYDRLYEVKEMICEYEKVSGRKAK